MTPQAHARWTTDKLLVSAGWHVCDVANSSIHAAVSVAIREFPLNAGFGCADYLLYVNGKACGVIEAKKERATLTGVELQSSGYAKGLPATMPSMWESTGGETHFIKGLHPKLRALSVFAFVCPELLVQWLALLPPKIGVNGFSEPPSTLLARMRSIFQLVTKWGSKGAALARAFSSKRR